MEGLESINSVSFNQDSGCFVVSTSEGIRVFNTDAFQSTFYRNFKGGIKFAAMLYRTNIISFVGTGENPSFPSSRLVLWDDIAHRPFGELNFKTDVLSTQLRKDKIVVVLVNKVYVYNFCSVVLIFFYLNFGAAIHAFEINVLVEILKYLLEVLNFVF